MKITITKTIDGAVTETYNWGNVRHVLRGTHETLIAFEDGLCIELPLDKWTVSGEEEER